MLFEVRNLRRVARDRTVAEKARTSGPEGRDPFADQMPGINPRPTLPTYAIAPIARAWGQSVPEIVSAQRPNPQGPVSPDWPQYIQAVPENPHRRESGDREIQAARLHRQIARAPHAKSRP